jgi:GT2 family glycosyltransferase
VVIVNYHGAKDTSECLRSLHACDIVPRIVVVDNTPNDVELPKVMVRYPDVQLISAPENLGFGGGNNLGINWALTQTNCEFIFLLNNDAWVEMNSIRNLELALDDHPDAGIAAPKIVFSERPEELWYGPGEVDWRLARGIVPGYLGDSMSPSAQTPRYASFASGCAMLIRREVFKKIGGFNPRFFMYEEDVELCLRAASHGYRLWYQPSSLIHHVVQGSLRSDGDRFLSVFSPKNKSLTFYVAHVIKNRVFNLRLHGNVYRKFLFGCFFPLYLAKLTLIFAAGGRWDGVRALYRAIAAGFTEKCSM